MAFSHKIYQKINTVSDEKNSYEMDLEANVLLYTWRFYFVFKKILCCERYTFFKMRIFGLIPAVLVV